MNRALVPVALILLAIGLFVFYTDSAYQGTKGLSAELKQYNTALEQSQQVLDLRDELLTKRNNLPQDGVARLQLLLPDNIDNIRLIIDINDIAARYHLQVEGISLGGGVSEQASSGAAAPGPSSPTDPASSVGKSSSPVGSVTLGFSVNASYANINAFLHDLERSLRLVDVTNISFSVGDKDVNNYSLVLRTYWLK